MIELHADKQDIEDFMTMLKIFPKGLEKATSRAINKTLVSTRAFMVKMVREGYVVKAKDVRGQLHIRKSNWNKLHGKVHGASSPGVPLFLFVRGSKKTPSTRRLKSGAYRPRVGVPVLIRKSKGKKSAKGVFLAKMPSGHIGAFKRVGGHARTGKQAIREAFGPSPIKILASDHYDEQIDDFADKTLQKNFQHEADYALKKMGLR